MKKTTEKKQPTEQPTEQPRRRLSARVIAAENRAIQAEAKRLAKAAKLVEGFASTDETRKTLMKPWHDKANGVVVATDGKALIATRHGFNPDAPNGDYPKWQQVVPKYGDEACSVTVDPAKVAEVCTKGIRLAWAIDRKMNVYTAIPLPDGKHVVLDAVILRKVAEAMDANNITEVKAVDGAHSILAKNADTTLVAMPIREWDKKKRAFVCFDVKPGRGNRNYMMLDALTGRVISAPERSDDTATTSRAWADSLRKGLDDDMANAVKLARTSNLYKAITEAWKRGETDSAKVYNSVAGNKYEDIKPELRATFNDWMKSGDKDTLAQKIGEYMATYKDGGKGRKQTQNEIARIEKRIAAEDEIDALMGTTPATPDAPATPATPATPAAAPQPEAAKPQRKASKPRRAAKPEPQPEAPAVQPSPWSDHAAEWRDMTARNLHDEVRIAMSEWAAVNAPSVPEFAMIAADFALIAARSEGDGYDTDDYMEWRNDETDELLERIGTAFGSEAKAGIAKCL